MPYLYGNRTFVSYDDAASLAAKAALARSQGLGGIGFWELSQDDGGELTAAASSAFRSTWDNPFRDVAPGAWYEEAVRYVYEAGLMQGTSASAFSPGRTTTRGQIVTILHRLEGSPRAGRAPFTDVAADSYCADAVAWAEQNAIVRGFGDGTFRPERPITRQQLAAILLRYMEHRGADTAGRADLGRYLRHRRRGGLRPGGHGLGGVRRADPGPVRRHLDPAGSATRAQTAVILHRLDTLLGGSE